MEAICKADFDLRLIASIVAKRESGRTEILDEPAGLPVDGYHDGDGIWFFGEMTDVIRIISWERFGVAIGKQMHVYLDSHPDSIPDGVHDISVYGLLCRLYKWKSQTSYRGLVVLASDSEFQEIAIDCLKTFSLAWKHRNAWKEKLPVKAAPGTREPPR